MSALDGLVKRHRGRPATKGWRGCPVTLTPDAEMAEALEAYAPTPENKSRVLWTLVSIGLAHVMGGAQ